MRRDSYKVVKAYPNGFLTYTKTDFHGERTTAQQATEKNLSRGEYNGYMSVKTSKKVQNLINNLHDSQAYLHYNPHTQKGIARAQIGFLTLTLPSKQRHSDNYIKRHMLNRFLTTLQDNQLISAYLWRAEPQKNGNIHFHILLPNFVDWSYLRQLWNKILKDHGYIEQYRQAMQTFHSQGFKVRWDLVEKWSFEKQKEAYIKGVKTNWSNPNTTDIHNIRKVKNIANYVTKYMCKHGENGVRKIEGRIWGCSDNLRKTQVCAFTSHAEFDEFIWECDENPDVKKYAEDHYKSYYFKQSGIHNYPTLARLIFQNTCLENWHLIFNN